MRNILLGVLMALAAHGALALGLLAYFRYGPQPETLATLDLASVDLSFSEEDIETATLAPTLPAAAEVPPPRPTAHDKPSPPEDPPKPLPPDPTAAKIVEQEETLPPMTTPEPLRQKPAEETKTVPERPIQPSAPETPALAPKQAKIDAPPRPKRTIRPHYPNRARQRGEQGDVTLEIKVAADGTVVTARVVGSCGFAELDEAAVKAARTAQFVPARTGDRPVVSTARLKITFRLK